MELTFQQEQGDHCSLKDFLAHYLAGGKPPAFLHLPSPTSHFPLPSLLFWPLERASFLSPMASAQAEGHQHSQAFEFVDKSRASEVLDQPKITPKIGKEYYIVVRGVGSGV